MRVSRSLLVTLRDDPAEAEIPSHRLLQRAGYIRRVASGIYAYLPLMWRVLRRVSAIVREEMDATGALETLLPQLQPAELWQRSGRWAGYTDGEGIMFHLVDRQDRALGLGPTHEEVVTALAADLLRSYRQLPVCLYQIQTKFRDEIRPRFGLMRGREFIMKDAYSFHADPGDLATTYAVMEQAYSRIFARCGLRAVAVEADSGAIGGSASKEFMVTADAGEDLVLTSSDGRYAANQERAESLPPRPSPCRRPPRPTWRRRAGAASMTSVPPTGCTPARSSRCCCWWRDSPAVASSRCSSPCGGIRTSTASSSATCSAAPMATSGALCCRSSPLSPASWRPQTGFPSVSWALTWPMGCWRGAAGWNRPSCGWPMAPPSTLSASSPEPTAATSTAPA